MSNFNSTLTTLTINVSSLMPNETTSISSRDKLLYQLGFEMWEIVISTFFLPPINLIGIVCVVFVQSNFYFDSCGVKQMATFYFYASSDFSQTVLGLILIGFFSFFLNQFLTLLVEVSLNTFSFILNINVFQIKNKENSNNYK